MSSNLEPEALAPNGGGRAFRFRKKLETEALAPNNSEDITFRFREKKYDE